MSESSYVFPPVITRELNLPDLPSHLLTMALSDLDRVEMDPRYAVDMSKWHVPRRDGSSLCYVCLAGAVLTAQIDEFETVHSPDESFGLDTALKLMAIDQLRTGCVALALTTMGIIDGTSSCRRRFGLEPVYAVKWYHDSPAEFKNDMRRIAAKLMSAGL
jgi:hypothetical protein